MFYYLLFNVFLISARGRLVIAFHRVNFFSLTENGVRCGEDGLFVGAAALLRRAPQYGGREAWSARPSEALDQELSNLYGWPIDIGKPAESKGELAPVEPKGELEAAKPKGEQEVSKPKLFFELKTMLKAIAAGVEALRRFGVLK